MSQPLISVLMPAYNAEDFIRESIESILTQSYKNFEMVIINDGSSDRTEEIILSFNDNRIKYIKNEKNLKLIKTLNLGLDKCHGDYIVRMDSDDIAFPYRIEKLVNFMERNKDYVACGSNIEYFSHDGKNKRFSFYAPTTDKKIRARMLISSPIAHPSVIIRKKTLLDNNLYYNESYQDAEDYFLWYCLSKYGKLNNLSDTLLKYRLSKTQISQPHNSTQINNSERIRDKIFKDLSGVDCNQEKITNKNKSKILTLSKDYPEIIVYTIRKFGVIDFKIIFYGFLRNRFFDRLLIAKYVLNLFFKKQKTR